MPVINISAIRRETLLGRALRFPLRLLPEGTVVPILQGPLRGKRWIASSSTHGCWLGTYELHKQYHFASALRPGHVVYDLGANAGYYTLLASELVGKSGRVAAFEPLPENLAALRAHLELNRIDNVTVIDAAAWSHGGMVRFAPASHRSMGAVTEAGPLEVRAVRLDEFFTQTELPAPQVLKIDIEGGEAHALEGATTLLASARPTIFLATHGPAVHSRCCNLLTSLGYDLEPLDSSSLTQASEVLATARDRA